MRKTIKKKSILKKLSSMALLIMLTSNFLNAQIPLPPKIKCISVESPTTVRITWDNTGDTLATFTGYSIYSNEDGGPFELLDNLPPDSSDCSIPDFNTLDTYNKVYGYYMTGNYSFLDPFISDTLYTMLPSVASASSDNSVAQITWNPFKSAPNISSSAGQYVIYRAQLAPFLIPFTAIGSVPFGTELYLDTAFGACDTVKYQYKIGITDTIGCSVEGMPCESFSAVTDVINLVDNLGPIPPIIETATVNQLDGSIDVFWYPSDEDDIFNYLVQGVYINSGNLSPGYYDLGFTEDNSINFSAIDTINKFVVIAYDSCGNDISFVGPHTIMKVENEFIECEREVKLKWSPYIGWKGVRKYVIECQFNGGAFQFVDSTSNLEYVHKLDTTGTFCYRIIAYSDSTQRPSYSNQICQEVTYPKVNEFTYLSSVDVLSNTAIEIRAYIDTNVQNIKYELYKTESLDDDFELITTINQPTQQDFISYIDNNVSTFDNDYFYQWKSIDICDNYVSESNISSNIRLEANANPENFSNLIQWKPYNIWEGGIESYNIYKKNIFTNQYNLIGNVPVGTQVFFENVESFGTTQGGFCYVVEAVEFPNSFGISERAKSNESCAIQPPIFWVPNAMVIDGFNNEFKPTALFLDFSKYKMEIYNRWNQLIFTSNTYQIGWNGRYKGNTVQTGAYAYYISYVDGNGQSQAQAGTVFVLE